MGTYHSDSAREQQERSYDRQTAWIVAALLMLLLAVPVLLFIRVVTGG